MENVNIAQGGHRLLRASLSLKMKSTPQNRLNLVYTSVLAQKKSVLGCIDFILSLLRLRRRCPPGRRDVVDVLHLASYRPPFIDVPLYIGL